MRESKFRLWDEKLGMDYDPICGTDLNFSLRFCNGILMQFTGLCDKNGKEIYEGDIIKVNHMNAGSINGETGEVYFDEIGAFLLRGTKTNLCIGYYAGASEIIGNIYENPELLVKVKDINK